MNVGIPAIVMVLSSVTLHLPGQSKYTPRPSIVSPSRSTPQPAANQGRSLVAKELAKISTHWADAWSKKQLEQILAMYAQDAVFLTGSGDRITGLTAIHTAFKKALETNASSLQVRSLATEQSGNLAYDSGDYQETMTTVASGATQESHGNYVIVFKRQPNGKWLIVQHVWTDAPRSNQ